MSSGTAMFGNFASMQEQPAKKKPPKSPKGTIIENPLLKNVQFSSYGGGVSALTTRTTTTTRQAMSLSRSPLVAMTPNRDNLQQGNQQSQNPAYAKQIATPGPPPRMSLSLMGGMAMPMQMDASAAKDPQMKQQEQRFDTLKTPAALSTPMPGGSTPLLVKKANTDNDNDSYFKAPSGFSSESLVADHWVVAHGYTSSSEFKELLGVLSSYGTIQTQEAGGNWLAVQYESRLSAEKALCCQPILLSNTLCGMTRGTPTLLQSLSSGKGEKHQQDLFPGGGGVKATEPPEERQHDGKNVVARGTRGNLNERDILRLENSAYESRQPYQPKSVCDRVFAWYFGWDEHSHSD